MHKISEEQLINNVINDSRLGIADYVILRKKDIRGNEFYCIYMQPLPNASLTNIRSKIEKHVIGAGVYLCLSFVSKIPYDENGKVIEKLLENLFIIDNFSLDNAKSCLDKKNISGNINIMHSNFDREEIYTKRVLDQQGFNEFEEHAGIGALYEKIETGKSDQAHEKSFLDGKDLDLSGWPNTLSKALLKAAENKNGFILYIDDIKKRNKETYEAILEKAQKYLSELRACGLNKGDVCVLHLDSSIDFIVAFWACVLGGIIPLPIPLVKIFDDEDEILNLFPYLNDQLKKIVIISTEDSASQIQNYLKSVFNITCVSISLAQLKRSTSIAEISELMPEDRVLMLMTSGSSGQPKLVLHTHNSIAARSVGTILNNKFSISDVSLNWFAFDHVGALVMFHLRDVFCGCSQVHVRTSHILENPIRWIEYINEYRVNVTWAPSFAYELVLIKAQEAKNKSFDLSCLKFILNGGEAINVHFARSFMNYFSQYKLASDVMHPAWGMTETASGIAYSEFFSLESTSDNDKHAIVGKPIPGCSIRIVGDDEQILSQGTVGKLQVKGQSLMLGYLADLNNGKSSFTQDGWFDTGDLAIVTGAGLTIVGRDKDIVIVNGKNYSCSQIEQAIKKVDGISKTNICVIPIKEKNKSTENILVFVNIIEVKKSSQIYGEIKNLIVNMIGSSPSYILSIKEEDFLRTTIGKIKKSQMRRNFIAGKYVQEMEQFDRVFNQEKFIPSWFYTPIWFRKNIVSNIAETTVNTLIFIDEPAFDQGSIENIIKLVNGIPVFLGLDYKEEKGMFSANFQNPEHLSRVFESLSRQRNQYNRIIYINTKRSDLMYGDEAITRHIYSIINICQKLLRANKGPIKFLYMDVMSEFKELKELSNLISAPVKSLLKSLMHENKNFSFKSIAIEASALKVKPSILLAEFDEYNADEDVGFYKQERYVKGLNKLKLSVNQTSFVGQNQFFIITGGLGAIGYEIARLLVNKYNADILIIGRRKIENDTMLQERLRSLQKNSNTVLYENASISDQNILTEIINRCSRAINKPIKTIFHAAGAFRSVLFDNITQADVVEMMDAKILGTINLLKCCEKYEGAKLVNFSSVNGFFGGANASLYSAVSAFQDSLATYDPARVITLSWSMWKKFGMSSEIDFDDLTKAHGFEVFEVDQGLASFQLCINANYSNIIIGLDNNNRFINGLINNDLPKQLETLVAMTNNSIEQFSVNDRFGNEIVVTNELINTQNLKEVQAFSDKELQKIQDIWKNLLETDDITVEDNFFDLGGHSLLIPQLQSAYKEHLGVTVKTVDVFKFPTIKMFTEHVLNAKNQSSIENIQNEVAKVWVEKLSLDTITVNDNFFDLGAHSLMIPEVQGVLCNLFGVTLKIVDIFKHPNVESLSLYIKSLLEGGNEGKKEESSSAQVDDHKKRLLQRRQLHQAEVQKTR